MRVRSKFLIPALAIAVTAGAAMAGASTGGAAATQPERFTGNLVDTLATARASRPFILSVDHITDVSEIQRFNGVLTGQGLYHLRDELWKQNAGYLSIGGGLGYPVAAVLSQETPNGRLLRVVLNRPEWIREVQSYARSSKYPFTVLELKLDQNGKGDGLVIGAAKLQLQGDDLQIKSLGSIPLRLLDVREG
ncbi:MAG TPA: hypothetical protein VKY89_04375 [Thermoanaerobaculia bacterium]|jgi:hypothetical protein|nr:hypothetical protein [Thermoanaerobaculia bacterium]